MKFPSVVNAQRVVLLGGALMATVTASPVDPSTELQKRGCVVNSRNYDEWVEDGLTRWRTVFSAVNIDPSTYCQYWVAGPSDINPQCFNCDGAGWCVDISTPRGPVGDSHYWSTLDQTRNMWMNDYDCTTS